MAARVILLLLAIKACGQSTQLPTVAPAPQNGWPITAESAFRAMAQFFRQPMGERPMEGAHLRWFAPPVAREENPQLEVSGMYPDLRRSAANLHLRCIHRQACGDFWAALDVPPEIMKQWRRNRRGTKGVALGALLADHGTAYAQNNSSPGTLLIQAGQRATVAIEEPGMQITLLVRCLEGGRFKQVIRVYDPNSHRVLRAEVAGVDRLRGRWQ
jgi:hypothetical protein